MYVGKCRSHSIFKKMYSLVQLNYLSKCSCSEVVIGYITWTICWYTWLPNQSGQETDIVLANTPALLA